tara:strand:- start:253 stop:405 length:153 start_codon:yes stop_codon:yes gene_type:complete
VKIEKENPIPNNKATHKNNCESFSKNFLFKKVIELKDNIAKTKAKIVRNL